MAVFVARAENKDKVAGDVHWVAIDVEVTDVRDKLRRMVEKFRETRICKEERRNARVIVE